MWGARNANVANPSSSAPKTRWLPAKDVAAILECSLEETTQWVGQCVLLGWMQEPQEEDEGEWCLTKNGLEYCMAEFGLPTI